MLGRARDADTVDVAIFRGEEDKDLRLGSEATFARRALGTHHAALLRAADGVREARLVVAAGSVPRVKPGEHCRWCPAKFACPTRIGMVRELAAAPLDGLLRLLRGEEMATAKAQVTDGIAKMDADAAGRAWATLDVLDELTAHARKQLQEKAREAGALPLPNGTEIVPASERRESIDFDKALPVLVRHGLDGLGKASVTKADILRELRARARGSSKDANAAMERLMLELRDVGAVDAKTTTTFRARGKAA